jgi:DNA-binding response OmpR family regulator
MAGAPSVLVVTDNDAIREELEFGLSGEAEVHTAREARDAWGWLQDRVPAGVIVDLQTGSAGGFALTRDMHATTRLGSVPVVILLDRYQDEWLARQAGAAAVFVKPIVAEEVFAALRAAAPTPG